MQSDVPAAASIEDKVCVLADRLDARVVTCSVEMTRRREEAGARVLDLRRLVTDLSPDHIPGEHLIVDLIRAGRQPQQAIGFLPDGDMVVVNDAEEMVGARWRGGRRAFDETDEPGAARVRPRRRRDQYVPRSQPAWPKGHGAQRAVRSGTGARVNPGGSPTQV